MLEIYNSSFNLIKSGFNYEDMLSNFCSFADRVTIAINTSEDGTFEALNEWGKKNAPNKLNLIKTAFEYSDLCFDGKIKNAALEACREDYCILLDADERINPSDRPKWEVYARALGKDQKIDALLVPVIDLCRDFHNYKCINSKWYLHKNNRGIKRGIVDFAKLANGKIDTERSDTCEAIYEDGSLVRAALIINPRLSNEDKISILKNQGVPFVWHTGWVDYEHRLKINEFWKTTLENRSGKTENNIILKIEELQKILIYPHDLPLWK